jgi:hypothetical protein
MFLVVVGLAPFVPLTSLPNTISQFLTVASEREAAVDCLKVRGTHGHWYEDKTYAARVEHPAYYSTGFRAAKYRRQKNKKEVPEESFLGQTMWAWNETRYHQCQLQWLDLDLFCNTMQSLNLTRVFLVGDSLMGAQFQSLLSLVGLYPHDYIAQGPRKPPNTDIMTCPSGFNITLKYVRENLAPNLLPTDLTGDMQEKKMMFGHEVNGCVDGRQVPPKGGVTEDGRCPWHLDYESSSARTLLILNQGAHFHSRESFQRNIDLFFPILDGINRPNDLVFFRATVPGHKDCFTGGFGIHPIDNYTHYMELFNSTMYDWHLFDSYNQYVKQKIEARQLRKEPNAVPVHYLNVFNLTVLRPDGHIAADDCLHYDNPGPIDWWNHLLFTNLISFTKSQPNDLVLQSVYRTVSTVAGL